MGRGFFTDRNTIFVFSRTVSKHRMTS